MTVKQIIIDEKKLNYICDNENTIYKPNQERVISDLLDTLHHYSLSCLGLSAPQIGYNARIFVMKHTSIDLVIIDPEIVRATGHNSYLFEGCMSRPGVNVKVCRRQKIRVSYKEWNGRLIERNFKNVFARVFQHELDHLNGVLI